MLSLKNYIENGGAYTEGVGILEKLSPYAPELPELRGFLEKRFASSAAQTKLYALLKKHYDQLPITPSVSDVNPTIVAPPVEEVPPIILKLRNEQRALRDQRRAIHFILEDTPEQSHRAEKCRQIKALSRRVDAIFKQLNEYRDTGKLPSIATTGDARAGGLEVLELTKLAKYYAERICNLKRWIDDDKTPQSKKERYKTELAIKTTELSDCKTKLKNLKDG